MPTLSPGLQGGKDAGDELVRALSEGHETGLIVKQRSDGLSVPIRLYLGEVPFSIQMPGRVEPCLLLSPESNVGPRLVGVTREQQGGVGPPGSADLHGRT